jgi:hypothetical protein
MPSARCSCGVYTSACEGAFLTSSMTFFALSCRKQAQSCRNCACCHMGGWPRPLAVDAWAGSQYHLRMCHDLAAAYGCMQHSARIHLRRCRHCHPQVVFRSVVPAATVARFRHGLPRMQPEQAPYTPGFLLRRRSLVLVFSARAFICRASGPVIGSLAFVPFCVTKLLYACRS